MKHYGFKDSLGRYAIYVKRKWWIFPYWERVENFLSIGCWNPVLLPYDMAKEFGELIKDQEYLDRFTKEQKEKHINYEMSRINYHPIKQELL